MWAAPPLRQWSPSTPSAMCISVGVPVQFATTKPVANRLSTGVRRKVQLYSQLRNLDSNTGSTTVAGNLSNAVLVSEQIRKKSQIKHKQQRGEEVEEEKQGDSKEQEKKLSGFDVLRALEKATAQKMKKKRTGREHSSLLSKKVTRQGRKGTAENEDLADYGNKIVRPLNIKEDWGTRLDELERRLEQLVDTSAA